MRHSVNALLLVILCVLPFAGADYHPGDYVPMARRAQFHGTRTYWHDVLGRHCPRFGLDRTVVVPLPRPVGLGQDDEYKLSLSFEGDRIITPWVTLLGQNAASTEVLPMLRVKMEYSGAHLGQVSVQLAEAPRVLAEEHKDILAEFHNATVWPKHLLVAYSWREKDDLNVAGSLSILLGIGTGMLLLMGYNILSTYHNKISNLVTELAEEDDEAEKKD